MEETKELKTVEEAFFNVFDINKNERLNKNDKQ